MLRIQGCVLPALLLTAPMTAAIANVIIDWDEKAVGIAQSLGRIDPPGQCVTKSGKEGTISAVRRTG
jgi:hypothetical protein